MPAQPPIPDFRSPIPPARLDDDDDEREEEAKPASMPAAVGALIQRKFLEARQLFLWGPVTD